MSINVQLKDKFFPHTKATEEFMGQFDLRLFPELVRPEDAE